MAFHNQILVCCGRLSRSAVEIRKLVEHQGGKVAFSVAKNETTIIIATEDEVSRKSLNIRVALKLNLPIVKEAFLQACIDANQLLDPTPYLHKTAVVEEGKAIAASIDITPLELSPEELKGLAFDASAWERSQRIRLFVSSTFRDMIREREALATGGLRQLSAICEERGCFFAAVDLRWGVTAEQAAAGRTLALCLCEVAACSPYFIAILGQRYGSRVDKQQIQTAISELRSASESLGSSYRELAAWLALECDSLVGLSITEMEIRAAVRLAAVGSMSGISSRCYFFDRDSNSDLSTEAKEDSPSDQQQLKDLKIWIKTQGFVLQSYQSATQLSQMVANEIGGVLRLDLADRVRQRETQTNTTPSNPTAYDQQAGAHQSYAWNRAATFVGRTELLSELQTYLTGSADEVGAARSILLCGDAGEGKTALLSAVYAAACDAADRLQSFGECPLLLCHFPSAAADSSAATFATRTISALKLRYNLSLPIPEASCTELVSWLELAAKSKSARVVLLVDDLDLMCQADQEKLDLSWLPVDLPAGVRVIYTCEKSSQSGSGSPIETALASRGCRVITLPPLTEAERRQITMRYLKAHGKELTAPQLQRIIQIENGSLTPLAIRSILDYLKAHSSFEKLDDSLSSAVASTKIESLVELQLSAQEKVFGIDAVRAALSSIALSRRGIAEADVPTIVNRGHEQVVLAPGTWSALYSALRPNVLCPLGGVVSFTHSRIRAAAYVRYYSQIQEGEDRRRFISFIQEKLSSCSPSLSDHSAVIHLLTELSFQLRSAKQLDAIRDEILAPRFITIKWKDASLRSEILRYWHHEQKVDPAVAARSHIDALEAQRVPLNESELTAARVVVALLCRELGAYRESLQPLSLASTYYSASVRNVSLSRSGEESSEEEGKQKEKFAEVLLLEIESLTQLAEYDAAEKKIQLALKIASDLSELVSVSILARIHSLEGELHQRCGRYAQAKESFLKALEATQSQSRTSDVQFYESKLLTQLGDSAAKLEAYAEAKELYAQAKSIMARVCVENDIRMAELISAEAFVAKKLAQYDSAEQLYKKALQLAEHYRGMDHPQTLHIRSQLADVYRKAERFDDASKIYHEALSSMERSLGTNHPDVAELMAAIATLDKKCGKYTDALKWYEKACEIGTSVFGTTKHARVASYQLGRAEVLRKLGRFGDALTAYQIAQAGITSTLGPSHPELIDVLQGLGLVQKKNAHYDVAQQAFEQALSIAERSYGPTHYKVGLIVNNLADVHRKRNQSATAKPLYEKSMQILQKSLGHDHSEVAEVLTNMSLIERDDGNLPTAEKLLNEALRIFQKHFGAEHYKCANVLHLLAEVSRRREMFAESQSLFSRSLQMTMKTLGENHPEVADVCYDYGILLNQQGRFEDAQAEFRRGLSIAIASFGKEHPKVAQFETNITHW